MFRLLPKPLNDFDIVGGTKAVDITSPSPGAIPELDHAYFVKWFADFAPKAKWCTDPTSYGLMLHADFGHGVKWTGIVDSYTPIMLIGLVREVGTKVLGG
jgi:hypothetical protein